MNQIYLVMIIKIHLLKDLLGSEKDDQEEDDLEIPAFLRRQKN